MKKLILIRHGKSSWELNVRDHDRVLMERGVIDAHLIGNHLKDAFITCNEIWSSTAARALQTAIIVSEYIDYNLDAFKLKRELYTFDSHELISQIKTCPDDINSLMIFSHNHGLTDAANILGSQYFENVPTTGVVIIEFKTDKWSEIKKGQTIAHFFPKNLR
ncbi:histidine phosphatase family protein [Nonlabens arenilitoris]|uniref:Histidine phosphatase family protein n=1 Tax=Nonlabens arenilitoris TaxID=1217969 RepID=A0A2S7UEJ4_9FLAO|nr:histidine phosphatase family protein [Nonlabens arenilitoris]PQJ32703.1 histidine phosphatase family protein [Nonlabens arenilitoris]